MQSRKIAGIVVIILVVFGLGYLAVVFNKMDFTAWRGAVEKGDQEDESPDAAGLKAANREAIERAGEAYTGMVRDITEDDHVLGDRSAPVKMIIYCDFDCPFCAEFSDTARKAGDEFGEKLAVAFRHFPMTIHTFAVAAALASECAAAQGKFWEMHDRLFADKKAEMMSIDRFKEDADGLGLDTEKFDVCLENETYRDRIESDLGEGTRAGVIGTPTIFINGEILPGAVPFDDYKDSRGLPKEGVRSIINRNLSVN